MVGLGRFGAALAETLHDLGHIVVGVDSDPRRVQEFAARLDTVIEADSTDKEALRQLGAADFDTAVVAIGDGIEASILTTAALVDLGLTNIWAKAISADHGRILERVGEGRVRVVFPEADMGRQVAHLVTRHMSRYVDLGDDFVIVETLPPAELVGTSLAEARVRQRWDVTVLALRHPDRTVEFASPDSVISPDVRLIVAGRADAAERFASLGPEIGLPNEDV